MPKYPGMTPAAPDDFQTPARALEPLYAHLRPDWLVWEPAAGKGNLVRALRGRGLTVIGSDIKGFEGGPAADFLSWAPQRWTCIITNPPYSGANKAAFLRRCYTLGRPFALLMPLTALEGRARQGLYREYGLQMILFDGRIDFETPGKNSDGKKGGAWYAVAWYTWGLGLPHDLNFYAFAKAPAAQGVFNGL